MPVYTFALTPLIDPDASLTSGEFLHDIEALRHANKLLRASPAADGVTVRQDGRHVAYIPGAGQQRSIAVTDEAIRTSRERIAQSLDLLRQPDRLED